MGYLTFKTMGSCFNKKRAGDTFPPKPRHVLDFADVLGDAVGDALGDVGEVVGDLLGDAVGDAEQGRLVHTGYWL